MIIIFLDFDGVLHHFFPLPDCTDAENAKFAYLPAFERSLRTVGPVEIVITSTWRRKKSLSEIRSLFSPDIAAQIIGVTPQLGPGTGLGARQDEVEAWLQQNNRSANPWIGVDDMPDLYRAGAVVVACHDGFRAREERLLQEAVQNPAQYAVDHPIVRSDQLIIAGAFRP